MFGYVHAIFVTLRMKRSSKMVVDRSTKERTILSLGVRDKGSNFSSKVLKSRSTAHIISPRKTPAVLSGPRFICMVGRSIKAAEGTPHWPQIVFAVLLDIVP